MTTCRVDGCERAVSRDGFDLCYPCWQRRAELEKDGDVYVRVDSHGAGVSAEPLDQTVPPSGSLSATKIGKLIGLSNRRINLVLAELGWIEKFTKGWKATPQGEAAGGVTRTSQSGVPYVVWPGAIVENKVFRLSVSDIAGATNSSDSPEPHDGPVVEDGRLKYPAKYRTADGHYVRSRAELSIDNWLYMQGIVHAYERKLPLEEDAYCDFYLPSSKVFIEYWGMEKDPAYAARKAEKQALYAKYGLNLVELADAELENLDDNLPRLLIRFGVSCI